MRGRTVEPVTAVIVTRGNVELDPILETIPEMWETIVWDNSRGVARVAPSGRMNWFNVPARDFSVYGRYAALEWTQTDLIYVQDDDVIVSDPQAIVATWESIALELGEIDRVNTDAHIVANMPQEFRHDGYTDSCLVGFGACFHRDLPRRAFDLFDAPSQRVTSDFFERTCDVVFTTLAPARVLVDVPITHREFASDPDRMWKQPNHVSERARMLDLARAVRDGRKS